MERMDEARRVRAMKSRSAFFGRIIWPLAIVIIFVVAIFFAKGCGGGGGGGSDTPKSENSDSNTDTNKNTENSAPDNSADPPLPNSDNTTPPSDNTDTTPPPDNNAQTPPSESGEFVLVGKSSLESIINATLLNDGNVLIIGKMKSVIGVEIFHSDTGMFEYIDDLPLLYSFIYDLTTLPDGRVLFSGTKNSISYDPTYRTYESVPLLIDRWDASITLLSNGKVLIAGGLEDWYNYPLKTIEIFDPITNVSRGILYSMAESRFSHTATLLPDGKVLIVGGRIAYSSNTKNVTESAELFDPLTEKMTLVDSMSRVRSTHKATLLPNGKVLITGGTIYSDVEIYDHDSGKFSITGAMKVNRMGQTATLLTNGKVLITGGYKDNTYEKVALASAEIYDQETGVFTLLKNSMSFPRANHFAVLLHDGRLFIIGGMDASSYSSKPVVTAEIYK